MFSLLLTKGKINSFEQLKDNFDLEAIRLYYFGGSLIKWLEMCGKSEIAERVRNIDPNKDIDIQLAEIFEQPIPLKADIKKAQKFADAKKSIFSFILRDNPLKYAVSANSCSFFLQMVLSGETITDSHSLDNNMNENSFFDVNGSFENKTGSFKYGIGSFRYGSEYEREYERESEAGSFGYKAASFAFEQRSFSASVSSYLSSNTSFFLKTNSFNYKETSFFLNKVSFETGSFLNKNILSSFSPSSFISSFSPSSFTSCCDNVLKDNSENNSEEISKSPEEKIYENLSYCPLNRFGYGIHLI